MTLERRGTSRISHLRLIIGVPPWPRGIASLSYPVKSDAKTAFEFYRKKLGGWKELPNTSVTSQGASGMFSRAGNSSRTTPRSGYEIELLPTWLMHSTLVGAVSCSANCTGEAQCVAQLPICPVPPPKLLLSMTLSNPETARLTSRNSRPAGSDYRALRREA